MAWARAATRDEAMTPDDVTSLILRVHALLPLLRGPLGAAGDLQTVWRLVNLAIDYNPPRRTRWLTLAKAALQHAAGLPVQQETVLPDVPRGGSVEDFEQAAAAARDAQTLLRQFPGVGGLSSDDAAWVEEECAESISILLPGAISVVLSGKCVECGRAIAPRFTTCRPCSTPAGRGGGERDRRPTTGGRRTAGRAAGRALGGRQGGPRGRSRRG
jgi:ATP-dependent RNA helicase SUPV3L1/SUV3